MSRSMGNGGLILDPFAGGGSVGLAAKRAGRKAVLIEIEERHCETAARRCAAEMDYHRPLLLPAPTWMKGSDESQ